MLHYQRAREGALLGGQPAGCEIAMILKLVAQFEVVSRC